MKCKITLFLLICYLRYSELANKLIKLDNGWNLAYPCKDNNKITMLVDNDEVPKSEFTYILSIQGIGSFSDSITLQRESDQSVNANGLDYIEDQFKLATGQMSFSTELKGHNGKLPKIKSISIDGVNYCKEPEKQIVVSTPRQNYSIASDVTSRADKVQPTRNPGFASTTLQQINFDKLAQGSRGNEGEAVCGIRKIEHTGLIVKGYDSKPGDWPWHAAINILEKTYIKYICGGTLISKFIVLTAAHCVTETGVAIIPDILNIVLGKYNLFGGNETPQEKRVFRIIVNEHFSPNILKNDIALLKLTTEVVFNDYVQPACIWRDEYYSQLPSTNVTGMVAGWGFDHTQSLSFVLQQTELPKIPDKHCLTSNPTFFGKTLNEFNFCAGYRNGTSACNGDSGGGYHIFIPDNPNDPTSNRGKWYVHGIVSLAVALRNQAVCDPNHYVLFTDVGKFAGWISEHLSGND